MSTPTPLDLHPHDVDAEKAVLGSLLIDNEVLPDVASVLTRTAFYVERHRLIYDAIQHVYDAGGPIDLVTLTDNLRTRGRLDNVGGAAYLVGLAESTPTAAYARHYAKIVAEKAILRDIIGTAQNAIALAATNGGDHEAIIASAQAEITNLLVRGVRGEFEPSHVVATDTAEYVDWLSKNRGTLTGLTSGLPDLDRVLHGFQPGSLYVVAARPSMGKTALALKCAYAAAATGAQVGVFSLEMPNRDLGLRIACAEGRVDSERVRRGELTERDWQRLADALGRFSNTTMYFNDIADLTMNELRAKARALAARNGVNLIVVDYLQLLSSDKGARNENRVQEVSKMSRGFKLLARELDVPVILLSQLSRQVEGRPNKRPLLSDLRESGSIEQDADVVLFLYRDDYYDPESADAGIAEIIVSKNRNGALATVKAMWSPSHASFESLTTRQDTPPPAPSRHAN